MQRNVFVCLAILAVLSPSAFGQAVGGGGGPAPGPVPQTGAGRIAVINSQEVMKRTPGYAVAESTYLKELDGFRNEMQRLQRQLDSAVQAFDQQSIALSPAARQAKTKELQTMQDRMQQRNGELQSRASQREQELLQPIQARVNSVIQGIRAEMNYALVIDADAPNSNVVAFDPALNITAKVLQRLQQAQ